MKALIALVMVLALIYFAIEISRDSTPSDNQTVIDAPGAADSVGSRRLEVVSFECGQGEANYSAEITVRNVTSAEIYSAKVFVQFNPKGRLPFEDSANILPSLLPLNAMGDATIVSRDSDGRSYDCTLLRILDSSGARVD